ncbi:6-pyruvoyl tetrahydropterin synthase family protein [Halorientalis brevis]|uniref:6-pyruvoyl tetrahydropterin synthase family protein n=1 Tax=Halorientalis brevis TaxID=1126241 RepID=A0ABD6CAU2_9EURY|nr:6-carboxytetrahydropterin synthase [Halorientalis brevis]
MTDDTYTLNVSEPFVAQHYLTVPDPGPEGDLHSHQYEVEVELEAESLNEWGYLVDIDAVTATIDDLVARYRDATLNDLPEFGDDNPSVERFTRLFCDRFLDQLPTDRLTSVTVRIHEDDVAWAAYERTL